MEMRMQLDKRVEDLLDKQAIYENMMIYCRAIDRMDPALMKTTYWPDATDDHGRYVGDAHGWCEVAVQSKEILVSCNHHCSNVLIELDGDHARRETMFIVVTSYKDGPKHQFLGGRYRDLCEKREGEWRVLNRTCIWDWNRKIIAAPGWDIMQAPEFSNWGQFYPNDPIYAADWGMVEHTSAKDSGRPEVSTSQ
jgi:hypothetical protein